MGICTPQKKNRNDKIYELRKEGWLLKKIGKRYNLTKQRISRILKSYPPIDK